MRIVSVLALWEALAWMSREVKSPLGPPQTLFVPKDE